MKKIFIFLVMSIFLISFTSALTFDNVKDYNSDLKEVTIKNSVLGIPFLELDEVAKIKLTSELNVIVPRGYQKVAEFDLEYYKDDNGGLDLIEFYDIKSSMDKIERVFDYKIKSIEQVEVNDYEEVCSISKDTKEINQTESCEQVLIGTHLEDKIVWNDFDKKTLLKSKSVTIGVFTDVQKRDNIEWIPTFYGVEINEWASWTESLSAGLKSYYKLDETSGTTVTDSLGTNNLTNTGATVNQTGKIGKAYSFVTDDYIENPPLLGSSFTLSLWTKTNTISGADDFIYSKDDGGVWADVQFRLYRKDAKFYFELGNTAGSSFSTDTSSKGNIATGTWYHIVVTFDGTNLILYLDNSSADTATFSGTRVSATRSAYISGRAGGLYYDGTLDEIGIWNRSLSPSEITDLYNSGDGMTYEDFPPTITLNSPAIDEQFFTNSITFNCSASDKIGVTNVSLYLDGVINETNSSGLNNTDYLFSKTLDIGEHNWTCEGTNNNNETTTADYRDFNITVIAPTVTLNSPIDYYNSTSPSVTFNCSASDDINLVNVSLLIDGVVNETNSSG